MHRQILKNIRQMVIDARDSAAPLDPCRLVLTLQRRHADVPLIEVDQIIRLEAARAGVPLLFLRIDSAA